MQRDNLTKHFPRCHYNKHGKSKQSFEDEDSALREIKRRKLNDYKAYRCPVCSKFHIGKITD